MAYTGLHNIPGFELDLSNHQAAVAKKKDGEYRGTRMVAVWLMMSEKHEKQ